mgnify:CR=1 FL=1
MLQAAQNHNSMPNPLKLPQGFATQHASLCALPGARCRSHRARGAQAAEHRVRAGKSGGRLFLQIIHVHHSLQTTKHKNKRAAAAFTGEMSGNSDGEVLAAAAAAG